MITSRHETGKHTYLRESFARPWISPNMSPFPRALYKGLFPHYKRMIHVFLNHPNLYSNAAGINSSRVQSKEKAKNRKAAAKKEDHPNDWVAN